MDIYIQTNKKWKCLQTIQDCKKNGNDREISCPHQSLKYIQKRILEELSQIYSPKNTVHSFIKNTQFVKKNIFTNASAHVGKDIVINVDIEDFFGSINFGRVFGLLKSEPYNASPEIAQKIAAVMVYQNKLPQGAPTSPIISNMICSKLDNSLMQIARKFRCHCTRYADDITFSTKDKNIDIDGILLEIDTAVKNNGFMLNNSKTRVQFKNTRQVVTGLKVNEHLNLNQDYLRLIRSMLHNWFKHGLVIASLKHFQACKNEKKYQGGFKQKSFTNIIRGKIEFVGQTRGRNSYAYIMSILRYELLKYGFVKSKNIADITEKFVNDGDDFNLMFLPKLYDSRIIIVEGVTDIAYLKQALAYFKTKNEFSNLRLRFVCAGGAETLNNIFNDIHTNKTKKINKTIIEKLSEADPFFIIDSDVRKLNIMRAHNQNIFKIQFENCGYMEQMFDKEYIFELVQSNGFRIDIGKVKQTYKNAFDSHLNKYSNGAVLISSIDSYILAGTMQISKTKLCELIEKDEHINYDMFSPIFKKIDLYYS